MVKKVRLWFIIVFLDVFLTIGIFKFLNAYWAPKVAGSIFILIGLGLFIPGLKDSTWRKTFLFWLGSLHLFVTAGPLMLIHLTGMGQTLIHIDLWGSHYLLLGQVWHSVSEWVYTLLIVGGLVDLFRFRSSLTSKISRV